MITGAPDRTLGSERLEREMRGFRREVSTAGTWQFRETYIDRGMLDPFYLVQFRPVQLETGDDLYDQPLFVTRYSGLKGVCMTREAKGPGGVYWREISKEALTQRLDNFMRMFRENYLQPAGYRGDLCAPVHPHEIFKEKRFLYEIRSARRGIIGVGPKMFAGAGEIGAICGQVTDENGQPLNGVVVELVADDFKASRTTRDGGLFWFSKTPKGKYRIQVKGRNCIVQLLKQEWFGNIKGWLTDQDGWPVENAELEFSAPDGELFTAFADPSGKFTTGPLPAYPVPGTPLSGISYRLCIPDFMFSIQKSITVSDAMIGGTLRDASGAGLAGKTVILKQGSQTTATSITDPLGNFLFRGLIAGRYQVEVEGQKIHVKEIYGGTVTGRVSDSLQTVRLELTAKDAVIATERTSRNGEFAFDNIAPGKYTVVLKTS